MTKRVRGALMAAVVSCTSFVFGACGGTDGKDGDDTLTLKWYLPGEDIADLDMVLEEFNKRLYEKEGFKLDIEMIDVNMYAEKMNMNIAIFAVCTNADLSTPPSQSQCSCSHTSCIFFSP